MDRLALALAVLSLLGVIVLLFGGAAMLRMIRDLQGARSLDGRSGASASRSGRVIPEFAGGQRDTVVLVTDERCVSCADRLAELQSLATAGALDVDVVVLALSEAPRMSSALVRSLADPELIGRIGVTATPLLVLYDSDGREQHRRLATSRQVLEAMLSASRPTSRPSDDRAGSRR